MSIVKLSFVQLSVVQFSSDIVSCVVYSNSVYSNSIQFHNKIMLCVLYIYIYHPGNEVVIQQGTPVM